MADSKKDEQIRKNFFDGPASDTMSLTEYIKSGRAERDLKKKKGGTKMAKKHIMDLPTNVPRMMAGANLMNPNKADLNKDGKLSSYEKARGRAIEKNMNKSASS